MSVGKKTIKIIENTLRDFDRKVMKWYGPGTCIHIKSESQTSQKHACIHVEGPKRRCDVLKE